MTDWNDDLPWDDLALYDLRCGDFVANVSKILSQIPAFAGSVP
jgi:hypothetical protein